MLKISLAMCVVRAAGLGVRSDTYTSTEVALQSAQATIGTLRHENEGLRADIMQLRHEVIELKKIHQQDKETMQNENASIRRQQTELAHIELDRDRLDAHHLDSLNQRLESYEKDKRRVIQERLEDVRDKAESEINEMKENYIVVQNDLEEVQQNYKNENYKYQRLLDANKKFEDKIRNLKHEYDTLTKEKTSLNNELPTLRQTHNDLKSSIQKLSSDQREVVEQELAEISRKYACLSKAYDNAHKDCAQKKNELQALEAQCTELRELHQQLELVHESHEQQQSREHHQNMSRQLEALERENRELKAGWMPPWISGRNLPCQM